MHLFLPCMPSLLLLNPSWLTEFSSCTVSLLLLNPSWLTEKGKKPYPSFIDIPMPPKSRKYLPMKVDKHHPPMKVDRKTKDLIVSKDTAGSRFVKVYFMKEGEVYSLDQAYVTCMCTYEHSHLAAIPVNACNSQTSTQKALSWLSHPGIPGVTFMFLYRFVRCRRWLQILVREMTFEQLFGFLSFLARLLALTYRLPD